MEALAPAGREAADGPLATAFLPDELSSCEPLPTSASCLAFSNYYIARENPIFRAHNRRFAALESRLDRVAHNLQERDRAVGHLREREDLLEVIRFAAEVGAQQIATGNYELGLDVLRALDDDVLDVISRPTLFSRWWETTSKGAHLLAGAFAGITGGAIKIEPAPQYRREWELGRALGAAAGVAADVAALIGAAALAAGSGGMAAPVTFAALVPVTRRLAAVAGVAAGASVVAMTLHERQLEKALRTFEQKTRWKTIPEESSASLFDRMKNILQDCERSEHNGQTTLLFKKGTTNDAERDFARLTEGFSTSRNSRLGYEVQRAALPDGVVVNVRPYSSNNIPTLEIQFSTNRRIKVRYEQ